LINLVPGILNAGSSSLMNLQKESDFVILNGQDSKIIQLINKLRSSI